MNNVIRYNEIPVLTTKQIAEAYGTNRKQISQDFNRNKNKFVEGKHYILLRGDALRAFRLKTDLPKNQNKLYLWTERGALYMAKMIDTDTAWEAYERLVDFYFNQKEQQQSLDFTLEERPAIKVTSTPAPRQRDWYTRNKWRMGKMVQQYHITHAHIYHKVLERVGQEYDLDEAREIYRREQGEYPQYMADLFTYFPEMGAMADKLLDRVQIRT